MSKTILLADDSVTIQKVVELTFLDEGHRVVGVTTGDDAIARWIELRPDLVIADIHMPGPNGYQVAQRVKADSPKTPVLLLVGTFEPFHREEFDRCGADAYLKKPFDSQELLRQVGEMLQAASAPSPLEFAPTQVLPATADVPPPGAAPVSQERALQATRWESFAVEEFEERTDQTPTQPFAPPPATPGDGAPAPTVPESATAGSLSDVDIDRIARRVVEVMSEKVVRQVAWEVIPDLAEVAVKERLRELEREGS